MRLYWGANESHPGYELFCPMLVNLFAFGDKRMWKNHIVKCDCRTSETVLRNGAAGRESSGWTRKRTRHGLPERAYIALAEMYFAM